LYLVKVVSEKRQQSMMEGSELDADQKKGSELDADQKKLLLKQQKQQKEEMWLKKLRAQKDKG